MKIIDISLPIHPDMPVYPGTAKTEIVKVPSASGSSVLSEIKLTSHAGTHIDAPNHSIEGAKAIDDIPLEVFFGECRVVDLTGVEGSITTEDLDPLGIKPDERILFKTSNSNRGFERFYDNYVYLEGAGARYLAELGVQLVGIDALSVKQRGSKDNTPHTELLSENISIIEGLDLSRVEAGSYTLAALPLAFRGIDGSPTRAVLIAE